MKDMNHEELVVRLEKRLDRIEEKLDFFLKESAKQETDITWIKGYIKTSLSLILALGTGVAISLFKLFIGKI